MAYRQLKYPCISEKERTNRSICICYLKVVEGQVRSSTQFGTIRVCVNSSFIGHFDGLENPRLRAVRESTPQSFLFFSKSAL